MEFLYSAVYRMSEFLRRRNINKDCLAYYVSILLVIGFINQTIGTVFHIARFEHWWQIITCYLGFMLPVTIFLKKYPYHLQFIFGIVWMLPLEFMGTLLQSTIVQSNNIFDSIVGPRNFFLLMIVHYATYFPLVNFIVQKLTRNNESTPPANPMVKQEQPQKNQVQKVSPTLVYESGNNPISLEDYETLAHQRIPQEIESLAEYMHKNPHDPFVHLDFDSPENQLTGKSNRVLFPGLETTNWFRNMSEEKRKLFAFDLLMAKIQKGAAMEMGLVRGALRLCLDQDHEGNKQRGLLMMGTEEFRHGTFWFEALKRAPGNRKPYGVAFKCKLFFIDLLYWCSPSTYLACQLAGELGGGAHFDIVARAPDGEYPLLIQRMLRIHGIEEKRHIVMCRELLKERLREKPWLFRSGAVIVFKILGALAMSSDEAIPKDLRRKYEISEKDYIFNLLPKMKNPVSLKVYHGLMNGIITG